MGSSGCLGAVVGLGAGEGRRTRDGVSRRHKHPCSPQGCGCSQKGGDGAQREALGRSRGGFGTKACVIADAAGRAIGFHLAPDQAHELPLAPDLVASLPDTAGWLVADKGYASHAFRELIRNSGA
ncbi:MAG: hypothetical protein EOO77_24055 [Oxalobacteraceae bacterium]|nr:MAG: hypothetical protein EOO77_24055 [Oxalobacteraceae bacterium]